MGEWTQEEKKEMQGTLEHMLNEWDRTKAMWLKKFGDEKGFGKWFGDQLGAALGSTR